MTAVIPQVLRGAALSALCLVIATVGAAALPVRSYERAEVFATCSGRLAAFAARQRGLNQDAGETARLARAFDMLVEATMPDAVEDGVPPGHDRIWRGRGWGEVAALLADADYSFDAVRAQRARVEIQARIADCRAVLLPSG